MGAGVAVLVLVGAVAGCGSEATGPGETGGSVLVLNSTGQTLAGFMVEGESLREDGREIDLGASFDGDAVDASGTTAVSTLSSFNGSQLLLVDLEGGQVETIVFPGGPGLDSTLVNPSRATFAADRSVWVGGRGSDAVYRAESGVGVATRVAADVGTFLERVIPVGERLYVIDANIDDDGFTFQPLGPSRVVVLDTAGRQQSVVTLPAGVVGASDAVLTGGNLVVLAGGSFDANFSANGDGALVVIALSNLAVSGPFPLGGNGVSIELGADGLVYATASSDFTATRTLSFDAGSGRFVRGPNDPLAVVDAAGDPVSCWSATAVADDRLLCVTFRFDASGRLLLLRGDGSFLAEVASGFGSTDIQLR